MIADERADALVSNFAGPVAAAAQPRVEGRAGPADVPRLRRQHPPGVPPRNRDVLRLHPAREPQRARADERRLHVRQRAAREALRHPGRLRRAFPQGEADRSEPLRAARTGQHPVADVGRDADVAGVSRQVHPDHVPRHAADRRRRRTCRRSTRATRRAHAQPKTVREQLELHRAERSRARGATASSTRRASRSRHFDSVGQWRDDRRPTAAPIDAAGVLADGTQGRRPDRAARSDPEAARGVRHGAHRRGC